MPANTTSVRLQILEAMLAKFRGMTETDPTDDPYGVTWSTVALGPIVKFDQKKRYSLGIVPSTERSKFIYPQVENLLTVNVEFRVTVNRDDEAPGVMIEKALAVVQRALVEDRTWGDLALDTKLLGNEIDLVTYADRSAMGVCVCTVQYRHAYSDPRDPNPEF